MRFMPDPSRGHPRESWWLFTPAMIVAMLGVHGFGDARVSYHTQKHHESDMAMFTVVAQRTHGTVAA